MKLSCTFSETVPDIVPPNYNKTFSLTVFSFFRNDFQLYPMLCIKKMFSIAMR